MSTKQHIFLFILLFILAYAWIDFLGPVDSNTMIQVKPVKQQSSKESTYFRKGNTQSDFIRKPSILRMFLYWIFFDIYVIACLYKIAYDHQLDYKWEYLKKCDILRFLQRQNMTVMCLDDYFRDRLNNNLSTHELMRYEWARYESFKTYPESAPHFPSTLARDGFYYTGNGTFVTCFCCGNRLDTTAHDNVAEAHRHDSPNCSFARGEGSANVPINHDTMNSQRGLHGNTRNTRYGMETLRHDSYHGWHQTSPYNTGELAEYGFLFAGDLGRCFSIGPGLRQWSEFESIIPSETGRQEMHSSDRMSRDMQSWTAQLLLQMGYDDTRLKNAILHFRQNQGNRELSAKALIEYMHDTEPNLSGPNCYSSSFIALASAARSNMNGTSPTERVPVRTVHERGTRQTTDAGQLQDEIDKLKHQKVCKICLDKDVCIVFLPCGHLVACEDCAPALRKCAVCRTLIKGTVRTYLS
ncbi:E3 ubiquitin-protein ligase XIAP-like isoform X2 [Mercenaria mercenaria]|nr:E3 ubiquitin-protein ligase XIAP-like isoform X2 [Mercenaria mercenaria]XP_053396699.1 E3 ubiquitin-protein ligase XIAP-like isoform X2 [Mercenaria mercenaria]